MPYFYGLPKITKQNIPLGQDTSNFNAYGSKLSNYLSKLLELPIVGKILDSHILNSISFKEKLRIFQFRVD